MNIFVDYREQQNHPYITELLDSYGFTTIIKSIEVGDFVCNGVIIEHKADEDYANSVRNKLIFQQVEDMKSNKDYDCYVLVSARIKDILRKGLLKQNSLFASVASIEERGVHVMFLEDEEGVANQMKYLFTKNRDGKNRNINPIRKSVSVKDAVINNYMTLPDVDAILSERLFQRFPEPIMLYTASIEELQEVNRIGEKIATKIYEFSIGIHSVSSEEL